MYDYDVIRSRRRTLAIEVDRSGRVTVRAPYNVSNLRIREFLEEKSDWIERAVCRMEERKRNRSDTSNAHDMNYGRRFFSDNDLMGNLRENRYDGDMIGELNSDLSDEEETEIITDGFPPLTEADVRELMEQAKLIIPPRVERYARIVGVTYGRVTIRAQKTRWGSCSSKGNLNFNCLLLRAPAEILDYVIIHELCHRKEMNHSPAFWAEVAKVCPDYKRHRRWLREHGEEIMR